MNGCIIPEENEKSINPQQENAIFLVMGDEAYTDEMIDEYNRNAEAKTEEFNTNATNKLNAFNENATTKTNAFNENATTQTDTYNSNAATKLSEYNDNATAKEQSYNSNADTKTQAFNQNAAQKEYEFNQNALAYQEGIEKNTEEIDEVSNRVYRIENNLYDSGTAEGYFINIEDSSYSEFQNVSVDGVCEQETTQGIQLFNANAIVTENIIVSDNGKTITMPIAQNGNGGIDTNATLKQLCPTLNVGDTVYLNFERNLNPELNNYINLAGEDYIWYVGTAREITQNDLDGTVYLYGNRFMDGETEQCILTNFRITRKNEDLFEPYTGGQPSPSPDYSQPIDVIEEDFNITSCGKNLFDYNKFVSDIGTALTISGTYNKFTYKSNTSIGSSTGIFNFKGKEKVRYSFSGKVNSISANGDLKIRYTDGTSLTLYNKWDGTSLTTTFFKTTDENKTVKQIELSSYGTNTVFELSDFMISQDLTEQPYEPYQSTTTAITLPEGQFAAKISDIIKDQFRMAYNESDGNYHLYLDKNVSRIVLDGSEDENYVYVQDNSVNGYSQINFQTPIPNINILNDGSNIICSHFKYYADANKNIKNEQGIRSYSSNVPFVFSVPDTIANSVETFRSWLSENNVTIIYGVTNENKLDLGKVQMPLTYYPVTNVFTNCPLLPTIEVAYYRDFKTTIETMQEDIASNTSRIETLEEQLQSQATTISNLENRVTALEPTQTESEVVEQ